MHSHFSIIFLVGPLQLVMQLVDVLTVLSVLVGTGCTRPFGQ